MLGEIRGSGRGRGRVPSQNFQSLNGNAG